MRKVLYATSVTFGLLAACGTDSSSGRATSDISPYLHVTVDTAPGDANTLIDAIMGEPGGSLVNVKLDNGDVITAKTDKDPSLALPYDSTLQEYSTTVNATDRGSVTYILTRQGGTSAPNSTVQLPPAIVVTAPAAQAQVSAASGNISIAWSNAITDAKMNFFAYPCGSAAGTTNTQSGTDNGTFSFPVSAIVSAAPTAAGQCITLRIERDVNGTIDPAFASDSTIFATRYDYVNFLLTP